LARHAAHSLKAFIFIFILIAAVWTCGAFAQVHLPEPVRTLDEKINYLLFLQEHLPSLFEQGAEYDVDFLAYIEAQNNLVTALKKDSGFKGLASQRPELVDLELTVHEKIAGGASLKLNRKELSALLKKASNENLDTIVSDLHGANLKGLLTGLLTLLPGDKKSEGFAIRTDLKRIEFLKSNPVPKDIFEKRFLGQKFGLGKSPSFEEAVALAEKWSAAEMSSAKYLVEACANFDSEADCLSLFGTSNDLFNDLKSENAQEWHSDAIQTLNDARSHVTEQYSVRNSNEQVESTKALRLTEVPPYIGVFRGLAGADCSTSYSFPYVYMPQERTFFIYSANGTMLGYLMGTVIELEGQTGKYFYVHSISGPDLSRKQIQIAMQGLHEATVSLGVKEVVLPSSERIHANMNYVSIHETLFQMLEPEEYDTVYADGAIRQSVTKMQEQLKVQVFGQYDTAEANLVAHKVKWGAVDVSVDASVGEAAKIKPTRTLEKSQAVLIALDLMTGERLGVARDNLASIVKGIQDSGLAVNGINYQFRNDVADKILNRFNVHLSDDGEFDINEALMNKQRLPIAKFYVSLSEKFAKYGITLNEELMRKRPYLFYEGHLAAPDALTSSDAKAKKRSIEYVVALVKRWPNSALAYAKMAENPDVFRASNKFKNFIKSLIAGDPTDFLRLLYMQHSGYNLKGYGLSELDRNARRKITEPNLQRRDELILKAVLELTKQFGEGTTCEIDLAG
jgi:hypothetical protein